MKYISLIAIMFVLFSCKKSTNEAIPYYDSYLPLEVNSWIEYEVSDINHISTGSDTLNYKLREEITEEFLDDEGRLTYRIERSWKFDENDPWVIKDVWTANKTTTTAEKVEENQRFNKLVFPISSSKYWNGNAFNSLPEWEYTYDSIHDQRTINSLTFDSTVKVVQRNNINAVEFEIAEEIYANHIGLVYKKLIDYDLNFSIKEGVEFEMIVTGYGK